jgi:2,4-dienoyl-CoA reductase (NADPH2)
MRFGLEVLAPSGSALAGMTVPVMVRVNGNDFMEGGIGSEELLEFAVALAGAGAAAVNINVGWHEAQVPQIVTKVPRGVFAYLARDIKARVSVPVIASHRINDPRTAPPPAGRFLRHGGARPALIADPHFPDKAREGKEHLIVHCVACGQGCFDNIFKMKAVECLCNPRAGHEEEPLERTPRVEDRDGGRAAAPPACLRPWPPPGPAIGWCCMKRGAARRPAAAGRDAAGAR